MDLDSASESGDDPHEVAPHPSVLYFSPSSSPYSNSTHNPQLVLPQALLDHLKHGSSFLPTPPSVKEDDGGNGMQLILFRPPIWSSSLSSTKDPNDERKGFEQERAKRKARKRTMTKTETLVEEINPTRPKPMYITSSNPEVDDLDAAMDLDP